MLSVAFFTLLERKVLGIGQERFGPNKVNIVGLIQPFSDVIKLISKELAVSVKACFFFLFFPLFGVGIILSFWSGRGTFLLVGDFFFFLCLVLAFASVSGLSLLFAGWRGDSVYRFLGGVRALVQFISYEIVGSFLWFLWVFFLGSYFIFDSLENGFFSWVFFRLLAFFSLAVLVAERQRAPFDFAEGERELVSGFNVEYSSTFFAMIFLTEYGFLLFFCLIFGILGFGFWLFCIFTGLILAFFVVIMRGGMPRLRFDILQFFVWKLLLPTSILSFCLLCWV